MVGRRLLSIDPRPALRDLVDAGNPRQNYLTRTTILSLMIGDRHGFSFEEIYDQAKRIYLIHAKSRIAAIQVDLGFDHYFSCEVSPMRFETVEDLLRDLGLTTPTTALPSMDYLIAENVRDDLD